MYHTTDCYQRATNLFKSHVFSFDLYPLRINQELTMQKVNVTRDCNEAKKYRKMRRKYIFLLFLRFVVFFSNIFDKIFKSIWKLMYFHLFISLTNRWIQTDQGSKNVIAWGSLRCLCTEAFGRSIFYKLCVNSKAVGVLNLCKEIHFERSIIGQDKDATQCNILHVFFVFF